jgi:hypothetical protein
MVSLPQRYQRRRGCFRSCSTSCCSSGSISGSGSRRRGSAGLRWRGRTRRSFSRVARWPSRPGQPGSCPVRLAALTGGTWSSIALLRRVERRLRRTRELLDARPGDAAVLPTQPRQQVRQRAAVALVARVDIVGATVSVEGGERASLVPAQERIDGRRLGKTYSAEPTRRAALSSLCRLATRCGASHLRGAGVDVLVESEGHRSWQRLTLS